METPFGTWIDANSEKPPRKECYGEFWHSLPVIVTNGKDIFMGYFESWDDPGYHSGWKLEGPDGWAINSVTHWMYPPPLPNTEIVGGIPCAESACSAQLDRAIRVIENVTGFDDETTGVGEAWAVVLRYLRPPNKELCGDEHETL